MEASVGLWEYIIGGATVFGLIVTVGAWLNRRVTRKEVSRLIIEEHKATRELVAKMDERMAKMDERLSKTDEILVKMDERLAKVEGRFIEADKRFEALLKAIEIHAKTSLKQHEEILERLK